MSTERLTRSKRARMRQRGRALRRLRMIGILTLLLCLPSLLVWGSLEWLPKLKKSEFFAARVWTVKGVSYANAETLRRELDALLGTPLALIDRQSLAERLSQDPWINSVRVTAMYPHRLHVRVCEQQAIAWFSDEQRVQCLTADGKLLPLPGSGKRLDLPVLDQRNAIGISPYLAIEEACDALCYMRQQHPGMYAEVDCVTWGSQPQMHLRGAGPSIYLHPENWRHSLSLLEAVREESPALLEIDGSLDLRFTNQVILRRRNG